MMERGGEPALQKREQAPALHKGDRAGVGRFRAQLAAAGIIALVPTLRVGMLSPTLRVRRNWIGGSRRERTQSVPDAHPHPERGNEESQFVIPAGITFFRPALSSSHRRVRNLGPLRT